MQQLVLRVAYDKSGLVKIGKGKIVNVNKTLSPTFLSSAINTLVAAT